MQPAERHCAHRSLYPVFRHARESGCPTLARAPTWHWKSGSKMESNLARWSFATALVGLNCFARGC